MWLSQRFHWKIQWSHVSHVSPATEKQLCFEMRGIITSGLDLRRSWTSFGSATALLFPCQSCRVELPGTARITLEKKTHTKIQGSMKFQRVSNHVFSLKLKFLVFCRENHHGNFPALCPGLRLFQHPLSEASCLASSEGYYLGIDRHTSTLCMIWYNNSVYLCTIIFNHDMDINMRIYIL